MIRPATSQDLPTLVEIINDAAMAYKGVIPADRWHEPYTSAHELLAELEAGVKFSCCVVDGQVVGVMGIQDKQDLELIRHAYVRTTLRNQGIGTSLLNTLMRDAGRRKPILVGTWASATWAIRFYERNGFRLVDETEKVGLLKKYWSIPARQVETSVVLADPRYFSRSPLAQ